MQPVRQGIFSSRPFEDTFENTQWIKVKQMQPMRLCLFSGRRFEETFENAQRRKVKNATNEITQHFEDEHKY